MVFIKNGYLEAGGGTLVGYDSKGDNSHTILHSTSNFFINYPLIYKNGTRVVFTNTSDKAHFKTYSVAWDGSDLEYIDEGECSCVWVDPKTGVNWFIIRSGGADTNQPIIRVNENNLAEKKLVWDRKPVGSVHGGAWFSISGDGKRANGCFPWGSGESCQISDPIENPNGKVWVAGTRGCWYSMAPDTSYAWFHLAWDTVFNGHASIQLYKDTISMGFINLLARGKLEEYLHTKFSSNSGKMIVATVREKGFDTLYDPKTEIVIGRLRDDLTGFSSWMQITHDSIIDCFPDLWVNVSDTLPVCTKPYQIFEKPAPLTSSVDQLVLLSPVENENYKRTDSVTVSWIVKNPESASGWMIDYSVNKGKKWISCNGEHSFPVDWRSYKISCATIAENATVFPLTVSVRISDYFNRDLSVVSGSFTIE